ncbi:hypothetical protein G6L94_00865 [Agrobacterium rhizogenes]|nr:hypothetical protein [Rhizobium rhizogenes]MDJ1638519.1 hypothetical protein [Rhizobium rhizogenes]NTI46856.1 hypothetical protein [Rhizobium rhizogenes]NTI92170.1 hypothetical protein [Rhizobium rhizogenes]NTJ54695.1 hypothetical protein [Rhizobium rhizogenes]WEO64776.1 hypothetical protein G6L54_017265 [Rhizobium rhizogenes]
MSNGVDDTAQDGASVGIAPISYGTAMVIGVVTAFGAMESATERSSPRVQTIATPLTRLIV